MLHEKHFSLEQANSVLRKIRAFVEEMVNMKQVLDRKGFDIYRHEYFGGEGPNGTGTFPPEMDRLIEDLKSITSEGIIIKGIDSGLLDFPYIRSDGTEVYLCWKLGEDNILFWHTISGGFSGRRKIEDL
jgi:hypothetical protein